MPEQPKVECEALDENQCLWGECAKEKETCCYFCNENKDCEDVCEEFEESREGDGP